MMVLVIGGDGFARQLEAALRDEGETVVLVMSSRQIEAPESIAAIAGALSGAIDVPRWLKQVPESTSGPQDRRPRVPNLPKRAGSQVKGVARIGKRARERRT